MRVRACAAGALALGAALAGYATLVEPRRLVVRHATLRLERWPAALAGLRLALVADLHAGAPWVDAARVARTAARVAAEDPDLVALLGDFADPAVLGADPVAPEAVAAPLGRLRGRLGTFAVLGNHDWRKLGPRMGEALRAAGIPVLENDAVEVRGAAAPLWVAGLADLATRRVDLDGALGAVPAGAAVVLLTHEPDVFGRVPVRVALTVAGHTHGGQVDLPGLRDRVVPSRFGGRYARGHVVEGGRHLFVTSGVGTSALPVRLRRPPEVVVLVLRPVGAPAEVP